MLRRHLAIFAVLTLLAAAVNIPLARLCIRPSGGPVPRITLTNIIGPEAAAYGWPGPTPHAQPWPPVTQWSDEWSPTYRCQMAWAWNAGRETTHQMQVERFGWPIASFQRISYWWPWDDPAWATNASANPELQLRWLGVILNPLALAALVWTLTCAPSLACTHTRRARRRRRNQCVYCGYPRGPTDICPECGRANLVRSA